MIPNNASHLRITAAAGTELAVASFGAGQADELITRLRFLTPDSGLRPESLHPARGVACSRFRALTMILDCSLP